MISSAPPDSEFRFERGRPAKHAFPLPPPLARGDDGMSFRVSPSYRRTGRESLEARDRRRRRRSASLLLTIVAQAGELVVTPRLLVRGNPAPLGTTLPSRSGNATRGTRDPKGAPGRKPASSLPELTRPLREADILKNSEETGSDPPEIRAPVLAGGRRRRGPSATSPPERLIGVLGGGASGGRGRHEPFRPPLFIISVAPRSRHRFRAGTLAFAPPSGPRDRGGRT